MGKRKNVTSAEVSALMDVALDIAQDAADYANRAEQGYIDDLTQPLLLAHGILSASRAMANLAAIILAKAQLSESKNDLQRKMRTLMAGAKANEQQ